MCFYGFYYRSNHPCTHARCARILPAAGRQYLRRGRSLASCATKLLHITYYQHPNNSICSILRHRSHRSKDLGSSTQYSYTFVGGPRTFTCGALVSTLMFGDVIECHLLYGSIFELCYVLWCCVEYLTMPRHDNRMGFLHTIRKADGG